MDKTLDLIHIKVHALRMMPNYKPTQFEMDVSKIISTTYKDVCDECKERELKYRYAPEQVQKSFLGGIFK